MIKRCYRVADGWWNCAAETEEMIEIRIGRRRGDLARKIE